MNIEAREFVLRMSYEELWATAWDVKHELINTLKTHWVNHQQSWKENESGRLKRVRDMFYALGRPELHENIFTEAEGIFKEFNANKKA